MDEKPFVRVSRRRMFKLGLAAGATVAAAGGLSKGADAHDLKPQDPSYPWAKYEAIVNRPVTYRQIYQWSNIANAIFFSNVRNGLNGFQFSYGIPADSIQVVAQAYASANAATYDDFIWNKYGIGELVKVDDPETKKPATRNIFYPSKVKAADVATPPTDRAHPFYADVSMEGLQRRGVLFLC
jgi:hypothetical protein